MKQETDVSALILAAGFSSRMGMLKPLLSVGGVPVIEQAVRRFRKAGIERIKVVVGHRAHEIIPLLERLGVEWALNPDPAGDMLSSVLIGEGSLEPETRAFFLLPVDTPLVKPRTIEALLRTYRETGAPVIYPFFRGLRGHPPLIERQTLEGCEPDQEGGLREYLRGYDNRAIDVGVADEGILLDCDTPDEYQGLLRYGAREDIPTRDECLALWKRHEVSDEVRGHSRMVAEVARVLAIRLNSAGCDLNLSLVEAGGLMHDLAKGKPDHAGAGAAILNELGYPRVARIVGAHKDIVLGEGPMDEAQLIYLADKLVDGRCVVSVEDRFHDALERFECNPRVLRAVRGRLENARILRDRFETLVGMSVNEILDKHARTFLMMSADRGREIYLVRHGEIEGAGGPKRFIGQTDAPLSEVGVRQALRLRDSLRQVPLSAIYCSDLARSRETAFLVAEPHGILPEIGIEWREIGLGEWDGLEFETVRATSPELFRERGRDPVHTRPPGGESFFDCARRIIPAFYAMLQGSTGNVLLVGHAGVNRIILSQVLGKSLADLFSIRQEYGCVNVVRQDALDLEVVRLNEQPVPALELVS